MYKSIKIMLSISTDHVTFEHLFHVNFLNRKNEPFNIQQRQMPPLGNSLGTAPGASFAQCAQRVISITLGCLVTYNVLFWYSAVIISAGFITYIVFYDV